MSTMISIQEPVFAFTSGETFEEYCSAQPLELAGLLRRIFAGVRIDPDTQLYLATYPTRLTCVAVVDDQTPDTVLIAPILMRIAETCSRMELRFLSTDMDMAALNRLTDDDLDLVVDLDDIDLPLLLYFDDAWNQQARWGPRPASAKKQLDRWLAEHPTYETLLNEDESDAVPELEQLTEQLIQQMRLWYNDGLTAATIGEIRTILEKLESN